MIKIPLHLQSAGRAKPNTFLKAQARAYWSELNPIISGSYTQKSLISTVKKYRDLADNLDPG